MTVITPRMSSAIVVALSSQDVALQCFDDVESCELLGEAAYTVGDTG